jgi:diadenosine tetraphosphate (Ap4A) HIT family hydrolase
LTAFYDVNPSAELHLLIIPNAHLGSIKTLKQSHAGLIQDMLDLGERLFAESAMQRMGDAKRPIMGFHVPPFTSVAHLHLHVLGGAFKSPFRALKYLSSMNAPWWIRGADLLQRLRDRSVT